MSLKKKEAVFMKTYQKLMRFPLGSIKAEGFSK